MNAGYSAIPSRNFLEELRDDEFRDGFVADHVRTRLALLIRTLREQRGWSQADLAHRLGKTQSVISRLEDPDYGKLTLRTLFEIASAFKLPLYIDMPNWDDWFRLMADMSSRNLERRSFDIGSLIGMRDQQHITNIVSEPSGTSPVNVNPLTLSSYQPIEQMVFLTSIAALSQNQLAILRSAPTIRSLAMGSLSYGPQLDALRAVAPLTTATRVEAITNPRAPIPLSSGTAVEDQQITRGDTAAAEVIATIPDPQTKRQAIEVIG
jgi:transcriptional regulator with XRE-family HTH domain